MGWLNDIINFFGLIFGYVLNFFYNITNNYGISILLFTIVTRVLMFPLTISQQKTSARMARLSPKQKELQQKYANNKQKYQEELQKLYQKEGVSSSGGCLPMLVQMPILFGLYAAIRQPMTLMLRLPQAVADKAVAALGEKAGTNTYAQITALKKLVEGTPSFFAERLNAIQPDLYNQLSKLAHSFDLGINLLQVPKVEMDAGRLFPIILVPIAVFISQYLSFWLTQKITKNQQQMPGCSPAVMGIGMAAMSAYFAYSFAPAALAFYWICSSLLGPLQSYIVQKYYSAGLLNAKTEAQRFSRLKLDERETIEHAGYAEFFPDYSAAKEDSAKDDKAAKNNKKNTAKGGNSNNNNYRGKKK
ncbi:MAG: YidC/Oxa1 family membrane protein insertase [Oscillospiraceae bacterium]|jgi:YidC/Oxa1 family membrane protein insertase|nr:YidC/Oxa1 family membrane protein insertase [Oscillospiraceae bacterium]